MLIEEIAVRDSAGSDKLRRKQMERLIADKSVRLRFYEERKRHQRDRRESNYSGGCNSLHWYYRGIRGPQNSSILASE